MDVGPEQLNDKNVEMTANCTTSELLHNLPILDGYSFVGHVCVGVRAVAESREAISEVAERDGPHNWRCGI